MSRRKVKEHHVEGDEGAMLHCWANNGYLVLSIDEREEFKRNATVYMTRAMASDLRDWLEHEFLDKV